MQPKNVNLPQASSFSDDQFALNHFMKVLSLASMLFVLLVISLRLLGNQSDIAGIINIPISLTLSGFLAAWVLSREGRFQIAAYIYVSTVWILTTSAAFAEKEITTTVVSTYFVVVILSSLMIGWRSALAFAFLSAIATFFIDGERVELRLENSLLLMVGYLLLYAIIGRFQNAIQKVQTGKTELTLSNQQLVELRKALEARVQERTAALEKRANQLQIVASVARTVATLKDLETLLPEITEIVSERFGFYHTGIFLVNPTESHAVLQASNSEGGKRMLARQHQLKLDSTSIVGYATSRGQARIASDVDADTVHLDNPDLPETKSELALPLRAGGRTIGALDVQSTQKDAFSQEDINVLSTLTDQIAIAIENARLFGQAQKALQDSQLTVEKYVRQVWSDFNRRTNQTGFVFDGKRLIPLDEAGKRKYIQRTLKTGKLSIERASTNLAVPIKLRGQMIGVLDVKSKNGQRQWTRDEVSLLEAAAERAALALENARLVDNAQRRAERERIIGEIASEINAANNFDAILQTAVEELGRKLGNVEVTLEVENEA